ncbi:hypothetical protein [Thiomicrorhabdus aquaedulcis]|uniref:hypothetical protein n=1 Tax=Thiomicrorhabdus aquaedulcis TaxID=2211106 RepID=UPI000FD6E23C|nr:hypothetical protein [Thiomicrorhabdus aquaedulcis]
MKKTMIALFVLATAATTAQAATTSEKAVKYVQEMNACTHLSEVIGELPSAAAMKADGCLSKLEKEKGETKEKVSYSWAFDAQ